MKRYFFTLVLLVAAGSANAAGIGGDTVDWQYYTSGSALTGYGSPGSFIVGSTTSTFYGDTTFSGNDNQIIVDFYCSGAFCGYGSTNSPSYDNNGVTIYDGFLLTDLNSTFSSVSVNSATNMSGFSQSNILWYDNLLGINVSGLSFPTGTTQVVLDINQSVSAVPLPPAAFMFAPALLGFMGLRRKSKLAATA